MLGGLYAHPIEFDIFARAQTLIEFARMLLNVPDIVKLEFQFIERQPVKTRFRIQIQNRDTLSDLLLDKVQVLEHLLLQERDSRFRVMVLLSGREILFSVLQVQVCVK